MFYAKLLALAAIAVTLSPGILNFSCRKAPHPKMSITIQETLAKYTPELMSIPGVIGTALGKQKGRHCITVLVARKTPEVLRAIPHSLDGFPVRIQETGEVRALDAR